MSMCPVLHAAVLQASRAYDKQLQGTEMDRVSRCMSLASTALAQCSRVQGVLQEW